MGDLVPHHVIATDVAKFPASLMPHAETLRGRAMLCRRTRPVPIECVARGYLSGSGWKEYQQTGVVCGVELPGGLKESDRLPQPWHRRPIPRKKSSKALRKRPLIRTRQKSGSLFPTARFAWVWSATASASSRQRLAFKTTRTWR